MRATFEASPRTGSVATSRFSRLEIDTLRALLLSGLEERNAQLAHHETALAVLTAYPSGETASRDRAMAVLHAHQARAAIEEIEEALARMENDRYGSCRSCDRPIPFERLEAIPQARFCIACPPASGFLR